MVTTKKMLVAVAFWLAAFALALCLDRPIAVWIHSLGTDDWLRANRAVAEALKFPGSYLTALIVAFLAVAAHSWRWHAGLFIVLAAGVNGINRLIQWAVGRTRPFKLNEGLAEPFALAPFPGGLHGLFHWRNLCFPSGHAGIAFATAAAVAMLWPRAKWRWIGYALAMITSLQRIAENAHWLSDVVAGAALGVGGVHLVAWILLTLLRPDAEPKLLHE